MGGQQHDLRVVTARATIIVALVLPLSGFARGDWDVTAAQVSTPQRVDRLVSDPNFEIVAPEFSPNGLEMSHCARIDGRVHIMALNYAGQLLDPSGASDTLLGECDFFVNGPEWGYTATEFVLAWTAPETSEGDPQLAVALRPLGSATWDELNPLPGSVGLRTPYTIKSSESKRPWLLYSTGTSKKASVIYKLASGMPLSTNNPYPTWKPDTYEVVNVDSVTGEIVSLNVASGARRVASAASPDRRFNPWLWVAPETGEEAALVFNITSGCIEFYSRTGKTAEPDKGLCGADFGEGAEIVTPEPFLLRERSYVSFLVETPTGIGRGLSDVYVAGALDLPGEEPYLERTSSDETRPRRDPEPVVNWRQAYIYYSAPTTGDQGLGYGVWQTLVRGRPKIQ